MKNITKKIAVILLACVMVLSVVSLVACNGGGVFTVKVVDEDGNPYTTALVQVCKIGDLCYPGVPTDANGVAKLEIGKEIPDKDVTEVEVHLQGLPVYLDYDHTITMKKGETVTVVVKQVEPSTPSSGTGVGSWETDILGNERLNMNPYVVEEGVYALKFTDATQKIYYEFRAWEEGVYKVYSVGKVDASVAQLLGTAMSGFHSPGNDPHFTNDNVSATDKNFSLEFVIEPELFDATQAGGNTNYASCFFEVALSNASDVDKDALIIFEYVKGYEPEPEIEEVVVSPKENLTKYRDIDGEYIDADPSFDSYVKGSDGYYHLNTEEGLILYATLGNGVVLPRLLDISFEGMTETDGFAFEDSTQNKIFFYADFIKAYSAVCNSDGRYPLTDELIDFFNLYIAKLDALYNEMYGRGFVAYGLNLSSVPQDKAFLVWCGIYLEADGSESFPYELRAGDDINITVPDDGAVYYYASPDVATVYTITSASTNVKLTVYIPAIFGEAEVQDEIESAANGFSYETTVEGYRVFCFSTVDGSAASYNISVSVEATNVEPDGTAAHPYVTYGGQEHGEIVGDEETGVGEPVYYLYTVTEEDTTLYFLVGVNTTISVQYVVGEGTIYKSFDELASGLSGIATGTVLTIEVSNVEGAGDYTFAIYNYEADPLGSELNPYLFVDGTHTIAIPAGGTIYYSVSSFDAIKYFILSDSINVSIKYYNVMGGLPTIVQSDDEWGIEDCAILVEGYYIIEFSTKNGQADTYSIRVTSEMPDVDAEEGTEDNPFVIEVLGEHFWEVDAWQDVYYTYTVQADGKLYFSWEDNTAIQVIVGDSQYGSLDEDDVAKLQGGIDVSAGTVITISVWTDNHEAGLVGFTISSNPID